jgi:hypothetical protein
VLVVQVFCRRNGCLSHCLKLLRAHDAATVGKMVLVNFRALLDFWQQYYSNRGRDFVSLEYSSGRASCRV